MARLTCERMNGIKSGYWSPVKKDELVQKLGAIEDKSETLISNLCDNYCKYPKQMQNQADLDEICERCPMPKLVGLIEG